MKVVSAIGLFAFLLIGNVATADIPQDLSDLRVGMVSIFIPKVENKAEQSALFDRARDWYRDVLGFHVMLDYPLETMGTYGRWLQMNLPAQPDFSIVIKAGKPITDNAVLTLYPATEKDLCRYYDRLRAKKVTFDLKPVQHPWAFEMMFRDVFNQSIVVAVGKAPGQPPSTTTCDDSPEK